LSPLPMLVTIEPTNLCNLQCPLCPTVSNKIQRPRRMMSFEEFKGIIDELRYFTIKVVLYNYGEPFLNPDILKMIAYAVSANMEVSINTNGHFFESKAFVAELIKTGLAKLVFSIDGKDQETYAKYRVGGDLDKAIKGLKLVCETKKELKSRRPEVELQFLLLRHNIHQRDDMRRLAQESGADIYCEKSINLLIFNSFSEPRPQELLKEFLPSDLALTRFDLKDGKLDYKGDVLNKCFWIDHSTVIQSDGTVVPCSYDSFSKHIMGNAFETPLKYIWKRKLYQDLRSGIKKNRKNTPVCDICPYARNKKMFGIVRYRL